MIAVADIPPVIAARASSPAWDRINAIEQAVARCPQTHMPLHHTFTPGLCGRSILIPAGTIATTRIHLKEHPFVVSAGIVWAWDAEAEQWERIQASHIGVTKAGTRRVLYAETDVVWHTFHVTDETDPEKIVDALTFDPVKLGHLEDLPAEQLAALREHAKPTNLLQ